MKFKQILKYHFILTLLCCFFLSTEAQVNMIIENLYLDNVKIKIDKNIYIEGELVSPSIEGRLHIKNDTNDTVFLSINKDNFDLLFNYKESTFTKPIYISFDKIKEISLVPCDSLFINFKCDLVRFTRIYKTQEEFYDTNHVIDYSEEMLEIIPTIRIRYNDSNQTFWSTQIKNVSVNY